MKAFRKIGILVASGILAIMGLSGCASKFMPLLYGVPDPNAPQEDLQNEAPKIQEKINDLKIVEHP